MNQKLNKKIATSKQLIIGFLWRFLLDYSILSIIFGFIFAVINTLSLNGFGYFGNPLLMWNMIFCPAYLFVLLLYCLKNGIRGVLGKYEIENIEMDKICKFIRGFILICLIITWIYGFIKCSYDMNSTKEFINSNQDFWSETERHELYMSVKKPYILNGLIILTLTSALYVIVIPIANRIIRKYEKRLNNKK